MVTEKYHSTHADAIKAMTDRLGEECAIQQAVKAHRAGSTTASTPVSSAPRTMAAPEWAGEVPWNWRKRVNITGIPIADFEAGNTFHGPYGFSIFFECRKNLNKHRLNSHTSVESVLAPQKT